MKYLFCTDGSKESFNALEGALRLVKNGFTADVFFIKEEENILNKLYNNEIKFLNFEEIIKKSKEIIEKYYHFFGEAFVEKGSVQKVINHLDNNFYNMVILGSHNYIGLQNQFFSFARKVLETAPCPVFIFRGEHKKNLPEKRKSILLCVDSTYQTLNAVISFMKNFDTDNDINLITVSADFFQHPLEISLSGNYVEEILENESVIAKKNLDEIERILCNNSINVKSKIHLRGNPSEEILNFVQKDFSLIVLGSHSRESLVDFLFGSVSKSILDYSVLPVLIVPTKKI
jgi:nucleotide-binding universal stress UspA family protein